ncbi:hypothetical protein BA6E_10941 [Bacteroidales bacterium 6E]|nr:hypothetical protein BA6E_10941 [Bacteroidales bacterium 6E]
MFFSICNKNLNWSYFNNWNVSLSLTMLDETTMFLSFLHSCDDELVNLSSVIF